VRVVPEDTGAGVSYGEGLRYGGYIEHRTHTVATALAGADTMLGEAGLTAAQQAVARS
jgi:hypothetical protein